MSKTGLAAVLCLVFLGRAVSAKDEKPSFPDDGQINLLLTQTERAFDVYDNAAKLEQLELGSDDQGIKRDHEVLDGVRQLLPELKSDPQRFNSPFGFLLVIDLDDASRNMAICGGQGGMDAAFKAIQGDLSAGQSKLHLARTCMDASTLLYTVSETATSLYKNYLLSNALLQKKAVEVAEKCGEALRKIREAKK